MSTNQKVVTLIKNDPLSDGYFISLEKRLKKSGYTVNTVRLHWKHNTLSQSLADLENQSFAPQVIAFSINAFFALFLKKNSVKHIIACSPSPIWKEVFKNVPKHVRNTLGKRRVTEINTLFKEKNMNQTKKTFIFGSEEIPQMSIGVKRLHGDSIEVQHVTHNLNEFADTIIDVLNT